MRTVGNSVERFVARALVIRSCDRSLNHLWGDIYREWKYHPSGFWLRDFNWYIWPVSDSGGNLTRFLFTLNEKHTVLVLLQPTRGRVEQAGHDGELAGKIELLQNDPYPGQGRGGSRRRWVNS